MRTSSIQGTQDLQILQLLRLVALNNIEISPGLKKQSKKIYVAEENITEILLFLRKKKKLSQGS